jgi:hypothetical protein
MLMAEWNALYVDGRPVDNRVIGLFRSLQVAFHAAAMRSKNEASVHDFGISVSHWVSAMEILLHPEKGDVNERHVLNELSKYPWQACPLLNTVQLLYHRLYKTRNDFIHGNDLSNALCHSPLENMKGPGWLEVAPLVFKAALSCFFGRYDSSTQFEAALTAVLTGSAKISRTDREPTVVQN